MNIDYISKAFRIKSVSETGQIEGYGSVFGVTDRDRDVVVKGAFEESIAEWKERGRMPYMLWQHMTHEPIGVWDEMFEDEHGLFVKGRLFVDESENAKLCRRALQEKAMDGLSIGFNTQLSTMDWENETRYLLKLSLWEISPVTFASNTSAVITMVKGGKLPTVRDFENTLRDAGFTRSQAQTIIAKGYKAIQTERDAGNFEDAGSLIENIINKITAR